MAFLCLVCSLFNPVTGICQDERTFDSLLTASLKTGGPGAVVLIAKDTEVLYRKAFGKANLELDVDMQPDHVFRLGSVTKQFTACAILRLAEEGRLSLQDDIRRFIPDFPHPDKKITIESLLTHTSGVKNYTGLPRFSEVKRRDLSPKELVDIFRNEPLDFEPGDRFSYSNSGYVLLGYIIEQVTGKSYAAYINETFFQPLGMSSAYYDNASTLIPHRASGYKPVNGGYANADFLSMTLPYAAGSLASGVDDLFKWYRALSGGQVISKANLEKAQTSYRLKNGRLTGYGYGWAIGNVQGSPVIKHVGIINGFVTAVVYQPAEKLFVTILANYENAPDADMLTSRILAILMHKPYNYREMPMPPIELKSFQGVYTLDDGARKIICYQDGRLIYYSAGGLKERLIPFEKNSFYIENSLNSLTFEANRKGFVLNSTGFPVKGASTGEKVTGLESVDVPEKLLLRYAGKYQFNPGPVFEVKLENGKLYGQVGNDKKELVPYEKNKFFARDLDAAIIFNMDKQNNVTGLTKLQNGEMQASRIKQE